MTEEGKKTPSRHKFLVVSLVAVIIIYLVANIIEQENFPLGKDLYITDLLFIITPSIVIFLGLILNYNYRLRGDHGKAWVFFTLAIICWFIGELTYDYEYEYNIEDVTTLTSDIFYIVGYPLFFAFMMFYLKPRKKIITKKMIMVAGLLSLALAIPSVFFVLETDEAIDNLTMFLYVIYPILDSVMLAPALIAVYLFFSGKVNFLWILILLATIMDIVADTVYLITSVDDTYGPSHLINIFWVWPYIMYAFGQYNHIKIFSEKDSKR